MTGPAITKITPGSKKNICMRFISSSIDGSRKYTNNNITPMANTMAPGRAFIGNIIDLNQQAYRNMYGYSPMLAIR